MLQELLKDASMNRGVAEAFMDGAYDRGDSYILLRGMGVRPVIKPRANARTEVEDGPQRQHSQHTKDYTENTACKGK
jgi:hypothetical protein